MRFLVSLLLLDVFLFFEKFFESEFCSFTIDPLSVEAFLNLLFALIGGTNKPKLSAVAKTLGMCF